MVLDDVTLARRRAGFGRRPSRVALRRGLKTGIALAQLLDLRAYLGGDTHYPRPSTPTHPPIPPLAIHPRILNPRKSSVNWDISYPD